MVNLSSPLENISTYFTACLNFSEFKKSPKKKRAKLLFWGHIKDTKHSGNLTQQWKMDPLKMYFLLKIGIFHCYVSLLEGTCIYSWRVYRNSPSATVGSSSSRWESSDCWAVFGSRRFRFSWWFFVTFKEGYQQRELEWSRDVKRCQVVVSNISYFRPYLGKWSNLTNIFEMPTRMWLGITWLFNLLGQCLNFPTRRYVIFFAFRLGPVVSRWVKRGWIKKQKA